MSDWPEYRANLRMIESQFPFVSFHLPYCFEAVRVLSWIVAWLSNEKRSALALLIRPEVSARESAML